MNAGNSESIKPLAVDVFTAAKMTSLSVHTVRKYIRAGALKTVRCGRRVLVPMDALAEFVKVGVLPNTGRQLWQN